MGSAPFNYPLDEVDDACEAHDACYGEVGVAGASGVIFGNSKSRACDRDLCKGVVEANCSGSLFPIQCRVARVAIGLIFCVNGGR